MLLRDEKLGFEALIDMDSRFNESPNTNDRFKFGDEIVLPNFEQSPNLKGFKYDFLDLDIPFPSSSTSPDNVAPSTTSSYEVESPDDRDSDLVLKFLNQILIEENMEEKPSMFHDPLALRATEKSLYDVIGQIYPASPHLPLVYGDPNLDSPGNFFGSLSENENSSNAGSSPIDPQWIPDPGDNNLSVENFHLPNSSSNLVLKVNSQLSVGSINSFDDNVNFQANFFENLSPLQNICSDTESIFLFKKGMEEARKFLPASNQLIVDLDKYELPQISENVTTAVAVKAENEVDHSSNGSTGRKHRHHLEDSDFDNVERSSKQAAIYEADVELSEMFDRVLLCTDAEGELISCNDDTNLPTLVENTVLQTELPNGLKARRNHAKKNENKREAVDLRTLLISCAQSVAAADCRTAYEQLKQIRQHSSPTGDVYQRSANVFAYGLEARLAGTGTELYAALAPKKITAVEKLKAYQVYLSSCPFKKISMFFANKMIGIAASRATALHIIDFGILYGFQWPILIQYLSERACGPPKLRITGIELLQPGFRPAERVEETGFRLSKYCERFGVPFEYQAIATQNWETINIEDFKIASGEVLAVNCLFRFDELLDETISVDSPRDAMLNLIRKMKPNIFINASINGSYSAPFFVTRFREALFHYSAVFDMLDTTLPSDNPQRLHFEQDFLGREVINVIACEGVGRVVRPETYKQWQVRHKRAGFKPLPLNQELMNKLKHKVTVGYHKDFLFDEDGSWLLQGWKGRIICATSCWIPD